MGSRALRKRLLEVAYWLGDHDNYEEALTTFVPHPDCARVRP